MDKGLKKQQWRDDSNSDTVWTVTTINDGPREMPATFQPQIPNQGHQYGNQYVLTDLPPSYSSWNNTSTPPVRTEFYVQQAPVSAVVEQPKYELVLCVHCELPIPVPIERDTSGDCLDCLCCLTKGVLCCLLQGALCVVTASLCGAGFCWSCWSGDCCSEKVKCPHCKKTVVISRD